MINSRSVFMTRIRILTLAQPSRFW